MQQQDGRRSVPRPGNWRALRRVALERDGFRCTWIAGTPDGLPLTLAELQTSAHRCTQVATDVDHIGDAADHRIEQLRSLCGPHHLHITGVRAAAVKNARRYRPAEQHPGIIQR